RLFLRVGQELRGSFEKASCAASFSSTETSGSCSLLRSSARRSAYFLISALRRRSRWTWDVLAIDFSLRLSSRRSGAPPREAGRAVGETNPAGNGPAGAPPDSGRIAGAQPRPPCHAARGRSRRARTNPP